MLANCAWRNPLFSAAVIAYYKMRLVVAFVAKMFLLSFGVPFRAIQPNPARIAINHNKRFALTVYRTFTGTEFRLRKISPKFFFTVRTNLFHIPIIHEKGLVVKAASEMIGAMQAEWEEVVGVERETEYVEIAKARLAYWLRKQNGFDRRGLC